jgi:hypothetical protein
MTGIGEPEITVPGICSHLPLDTTSAGSVTHYIPTVLGQQPEAELILGETLAHGVIRLDSADPRYYDLIAEHAARCAHFIREGQIHGSAA